LLDGPEEIKENLAKNRKENMKGIMWEKCK
jgi:hypothetical protein